MLEVLPGPPGLVAMQVSGQVEETDIERAIQAIESALATEERIGLFVSIEVSGMSAGAFMKDVSYSVSKLRELHRFPRVAVVSSQNWVRAIAQGRATSYLTSRCGPSLLLSATRRSTGSADPRTTNGRTRPNTARAWEWLEARPLDP